MGICKAITLDVDGTVRVEQYGSLENDGSALRSIYAMLGGGCSNFEQLAIHAGRSGFKENFGDLFIDGEGKVEQPINIYATDIMRASGSIHSRDWICGKVAFVGPADDRGNSTDVSPDVERTVRMFVRPQLQFAG